MAFDQTTRNRLQRFVGDARALLADEFTRQLQATYGMNPTTGDVADIKTLSGLTPHQQETAQLLRDTFTHYLASNESGKDKERKLAALDRIVREQAFTVLNRIAALRMSEARGSLIESLANGYESKGFQLFHRIAGTSLGETGDAYRHYLFSIFDEFTLDLSVLFDRFSAQGRLFPSSPVLLELLALVNDEEVAPLWSEDETIGWIYQYFNSIAERKKMRDASQAPRNSRELAVRNQFFTPRYVVEFLTDNTLGRIWYEMTQGQTGLVDSCEYLVRRPNEVFLPKGETAPEQSEQEGLSQEERLKQTVYIEHRALKDPRDIKMLDPACGSMHFGLYCFDLFEKIYSEAWDLESSQGKDAFVREGNKASLTESFQDKTEFLTHVPRLIIENNIHGVDIDPRAAQVAGLSLWQRAHNSWQQAGIKPQSRPKILKSNIVCAEPMPGEKELLQEFTSQLKPTVLGQLVEVIFEKMELAGEAGTLLKIEKEIADAIAGARAVWQQQNRGLSQFPDLAKVVKPQSEIEFDVSDIDDESFWQQAEQKILYVLIEYASSTSAQKQFFAADAAKGFAFIELCRKRFDVVLMNPPFGEPAETTKKYCKANYPKQVQDLYCLFFERAIDMSNERCVGIISSGSFLKYNDYSSYRDYLLSDCNVDTLLDLGWDVLDDAYVNTSAYFTSRTNSGASVFYDLSEKIKDESKIVDQLSLLSKGEVEDNIFLRNIVNFRKLSGQPFAYTLSNDFFNWVEKSPKVVELTSEHGIGAGPHNFFFRLHWEIPNHSANSNYNWMKLVNGGGISPYCRSVNLVIDWRANGEFVKEHLRYKYPYLKGNVGIKIQREDYYLSPGITYGKKTDRFNAQLMPEGCAPSFEGIGLYLKDTSDTLWLLSYLNSRFVAYFLNLTSGLHKNSIYIDRLPIPGFSHEKKRKLESSAKIIVKLKQKYLSLFETDNNYVRSNVPNMILEFGSFSSFVASLFKIEFELMKLVKNVDDMVTDDIILTSENKRAILEDQGELLFEGGAYPIKRNMLSFPKGFSLNALNEVMGKYNGEGNVYEFINNYKPGKGEYLWFYNYLISWSLGYAFLNGYEYFTTDKLAKFVCGKIRETFGNSYVASSDQFRFNDSDVIRHLDLNKGFFEYHYGEYSANGRNAPIYWAIQTPSKNFTIWISYERLNAQTLVSCIVNVIEPKLAEVHSDIASLKERNRNKEDEINLEDLIGFEQELTDFKDEIYSVSKYWNPNPHDGVNITAAPLWRLIQHKPWRTKLQKLWENIENGDFDWSCCSYSVYPERVLRKASENLSIAVAHGVQSELWHEVEVIKGRKKQPVLEWQPKPLSPAELNDYVREKIATDERLALYRSNAKNSGVKS